MAKDKTRQGHFQKEIRCKKNKKQHKTKKDGGRLCHIRYISQTSILSLLQLTYLNNRK